jgi:hypothetical protein
MHDTNAFRISYQHDIDAASDRRSRYGAYIAQKQHLFHYDGTDQPPTTCPVRFALAAWTVATPPTMAPGYVATHARIQDTGAHWDDSRAAFEVRIAVPPPVSTSQLPSRWEGWFRDEWSRWQDPYSNDNITVLSLLTIRIPLTASHLPTPRYTRRLPDTQTAKDAVTALCRIANTELNDLLSALDVPEQREAWNPVT